MGGTCKREVIKAYIYFAKSVNSLFGWVYSGDINKITSLIGAAACEISNGTSLHSEA